MKKHAFIFALAILVGILYAGPDAYHVFTSGYQGIVMADAGDSDYYFSVINKSYESNGFVRDPFHYEYQHEGNPFQYFPIEYVLGKIGSLLHVRLDFLIIAAEFFFPALLTLLLYVIAYKLSARRLTAFTVAAVMAVGTELVHPNGISNLLHTFLFKGDFQTFLLYSRPVNPQVSGILFFLSVLAILNFFHNRESKRALLIAGVSVGALAYVYPYFWAFGFSLLGIVGLYAFVTRNWPFALAVFLSGVACVVTMAPFLLANLSIFLLGGSNALTETVPTHRIIIEKVILLPLFVYTLIFAWGWYGKYNNKLGAWAAHFAQKYLFVLLLLITGVVVSNQQVLTGKLMFQEHFHFFTNIPLFAFSMTLLLMELTQILPRLWRFLIAAMVVIGCVWFAVGVQVASYRSHALESARYQELAPLFSYMRAQDGDAKVALTNYYLSTRLTIYTQDYVYSGAYDTAFAVPQEQLRHDYFVMLKIRGVSAQDVRSYLYAHRDEVGALLFIGTYWRDLCGSYGCFPDSVLEDLIPQYQKFVSQSLAKSIHTHKIDYILWDSKADPEWHLEGVVKNPPVYESGDFKLYSVI